MRYHQQRVMSMSLEELCKISSPRLQAGFVNKTINYCNGNINKKGVQNSAHLCDLKMKFVLLLGIALFLQGVDPSKGGKLFNFSTTF